MRKIKKTLYCLAFTLLVLPCVVFAAPSIPDPGSADVDSIYDDIITIFQYAFGIAFGLGVIYLVWGGIGWMTAGGDEEKTRVARERLMYGLVGILIIGGIYTLINLVSTYFGFGTTTDIL